MTIGPIRRRTAAAAPAIEIALDDVRPRGRTSWWVRWRVRNAGDRAVTVLEAWHPHGRFRSSRLPRSMWIPARASAAVDVPARSDARPGEVVENVFLILRMASGGARWRVVARSTLEVDGAGTPWPRIEAVDVHPAER